MAKARSLIDKEYLKKHFLDVYLEDAIAQMLSNRQEGNKSPPMKPNKFFREYFTSVHQGTHILFREFSFVSASPYNRLCMVKAALQIFKSLFFRDEPYNARDYHSLLQLVWPDFRMQIVQDAFTAYDDDKKDEENCMKFLDFIRAMRNFFCTGELNYEANIISKQIDRKIAEFEGIEIDDGIPKNLTASEQLEFWVEDKFTEENKYKDPWDLAHNMLDGSDFKRILNLNESSESSDNTNTAGKMSRSSSESKEASKSEKKSPKKKGGKNRGRLPGKHLSNSLNLLQSAKGDDTKKVKRRHRSKSAASAALRLHRKPWSCGSPRYESA